MRQPRPVPRPLPPGPAAALALALGALLRLPYLGAWPSPAGDEGNWALLGLRLSQGVDARLPPDAAFVTTAFGRLIAAAFALLGPSWAAARLVPVAGLLLGAAAAARWCVRLGHAPAAAPVALALAVHPWAIVWSRTISVPYALSLALAVAGPLAFLDARRTRSPWGMLLAGQLLGLGLHFSPLAALPIAACALDSFGPERPRGWSLAAALAGGLHGLPVAAGALRAARVGAQSAGPGEALPAMLLGAGRMMLGQLAGTSTAAHAVGLDPPAMALGATAAAALLGYLAAGARHPLTRFARRYLAVALVGLPLLLRPGRAWHMPTIDADRYGFALVAPLALALGGLACEASRRARGVAAAALAGAALVTLATLLGARGARGDRGLFVARGGGAYRGWQCPREGAALVDLLRDEALADARGAPAVLAYDDYAFHALRFSLAARSGHAVTHALGAEDFPSGRRVYRVVWADAAFAPGFEPAAVARANARRRAAGGVVLRRFTTASGRPLCELWRVQPLTRNATTPTATSTAATMATRATGNFGGGGG